VHRSKRPSKTKYWANRSTYKCTLKRVGLVTVDPEDGDTDYGNETVRCTDFKEIEEDE